MRHKYIKSIATALIAGCLVIASSFPMGVQAEEIDDTTALVVEESYLTEENGTNASYEAENEYFTLEELADSDELLMSYVEKGIYGMDSISLFGTTAGDNLIGNDKAAYECLAEQIKAIAKGEVTSSVLTVPMSALNDGKLIFTAEDLGLTSLIENGQFTEETINAVRGKCYFDFQKVVDAVRYDYPAEIYWMDLQYGCSVPGFGGGYNSALGYYVNYSSSANVVIKVKVSLDYSVSAEDVYNLDSSKITAVNSAIQNARAIVREAEEKELSDVEKLKYYATTLSDLNTYNNEAVEHYDNGYGDPWQIIYMFDGNPDTKVVCEGYAKGFQYLCDLSTFEDDILVSTVDGTVYNYGSQGAHMWNIVHMDDGKNYIVDATGCDMEVEGKISETFFLGYCSSGEYDDWQYLAKASGISYHYSDGVINLYDEDELTISTTAYEEKKAGTAAKDGAAVATVSYPENAGILSGGGKYAVGDTVSLFATPVKGYKFDGWYNGDVRISSVPEMEFSVANDTPSTLTYTAKFIANETNSISVNIGNGSVSYSYLGGKMTGSWTEDFPGGSFSKGTEFKLTAVPNEGYSFMYWVNGDGRVLSNEKEYSFFLGSDISLTACYREDCADSHFVVFRDLNGKVLYSGDVMMDKEDEAGVYGEVSLPAHNSFAGYSFDKWVDAAKNVISSSETGTIRVTKDMTIYAAYLRVSSLKVTVDGVLLDETYLFADVVTVSADEIKDGKYFSGWYVDGKLMSLNKDYSFRITGDVNLVAKYEGTAAAVEKAIVNLTMSDREILENDEQKLVMYVSWTVPEGYTFVEGGVLRATELAYIDKLQLDKVDGVNVKRNTSKLTTASGTYVFTLTMGPVTSKKNISAVGYITYVNDSTGEVITIYSDTVTSGTIN